MAVKTRKAKRVRAVKAADVIRNAPRAKTATARTRRVIPESTKAEILKDYTDDKLTILQIAAKHGVSGGSVTLAAAEKNVPRRSTRNGSSMKPLSRGGMPGVGQVLSETQMNDMFRPFFRIVWRKLPAMEERMSKPGTAADDERDSKTMARWVETLEKMNEVTTAMRKTAKKSKDPAAEAAAQDMDRMRREIAERLERLHNKRAAARSSE